MSEHPTSPSNGTGKISEQPDSELDEDSKASKRWSLSEVEIDDMLDDILSPPMKGKGKLKQTSVPQDEDNKAPSAPESKEAKGVRSLNELHELLNTLDKKAGSPQQGNMGQAQIKFLKAIGWKGPVGLKALALDYRHPPNLIVSRCLLHAARDEVFWMFMPSGIRTPVVNGNGLEDSQYSAATLFTLLSMAILFESQPVGLVLYWFCSTSPQKDAGDMVVEMFAQLLHQGSPGLAVPNKNDVTSFQELVAAFVRCIIQQLKDSDIYLVMDTISTYEDKQRREETQHLFDSLATLVPKAIQKNGLKIIVTSPTTTKIAKKHTSKMLINIPSEQEYWDTLDAGDT